MRTGRLVLVVMALAADGLWGMTSAAAGSCYSVRVQGCGRKARVCVNTTSSSDAKRKALEAFRSAYRCANPTVNSYSSSCSEAANDPCDLKL